MTTGTTDPTASASSSNPASKINTDPSFDLRELDAKFVDQTVDEEGSRLVNLANVYYRKEEVDEEDLPIDNVRYLFYSECLESDCHIHRIEGIPSNHEGFFAKRKLSALFKLQLFLDIPACDKTAKTFITLHRAIEEFHLAGAALNTTIKGQPSCYYIFFKRIAGAGASHKSRVPFDEDEHFDLDALLNQGPNSSPRNSQEEEKKEEVINLNQ